MRSKPLFSSAEAGLLAITTALAVVAAAAPGVPAPQAVHALADTRPLFGILNAADVLSSAAFGLSGLVGLWLLWRLPARAVANVQRAMALMFFGGLALLALGAASYHLDPHAGTLAGQRYCVIVAFAGLLGLAAAERVSERAGAALGIALLALGCAAVRAGAQGNLLPWLVLQAGGVVVLWWLATLRRGERALGVDFVLVLVAYGAARLLELNDAAIFEATGQLVSGHTLKHIAAGLAAWPVLTALHAAGRNPLRAPLPIAPDVAIRWWRDA